MFLDRSLPTAEALADPSVLVATARRMRIVRRRSTSSPVPPVTVCRIVEARRLTDNDIRLAYLAADGEAGRHRRAPDR